MDTRTLAHTDLTVSRLCLGTMTFGGQADEAAARSMVDMCLEHGVNFIDTANVYSGGSSETLLGRILDGRRQSVVLASKVGMKVGDRPTQIGLSRTAIQRQIDETLRRLGTDYLDIYYLHLPDYQAPVEETLVALEMLVRQGKVRYAGTSNYASWQICQMLCLAEKQGYQPIRITQPMYNLVARGIEQELLPMCREFQVSTVVYNPLAGGLLTGKHLGAAEPAAGTRFDLMRNYQDRYWHQANFDAVKLLNETAQQEGRSLISLALGWLLHHAAIDCVILGASRPAQLQENLEAAGQGKLSDAALAACDRAWSLIRGVAPQYNR